jgi:hypothetical protein
VFFVAKDDSLNKAHVQHLEARLLALAKLAKHCKIDNKQEPMPPTLSEAETALVENFLQDIFSIFPLVGLGVFERTESTKKPADLLTIESGNIKASGYEDAKRFVVVKGSQLVKDEARSIHQFLSTLRKDLLAQGVIVAEGPHYVFTQDHVFKSPSTAAGVVLGRTANGRIEWKDKDGTASSCNPLFFDGKPRPSKPFFGDTVPWCWESAAMQALRAAGVDPITFSAMP